MSYIPRDPPITNPPIRLGVLISGGGTTLGNFIRRIADGRLRARISVVVSNRTDVAGNARARDAGLPLVVCPRRSYTTIDDFSRDVFAACRDHEADLVTMAGFLSLVRIPPDYQGRVMNIHPALLPAFGGKGYYGRRVHQAVLEHGVKISGCTVHFVDEEYDRGPIVLQRAVPVLDEDTPDTLQERVFAEECEAYPEAVRLYAEGRLRVEGRKVRVGAGAETIAR